MTLCYIHWFDASYQRGECTAADLVPRIELHTCGTFVGEKDGYVTVAMDWCPHDSTWRYIEHIPRVNIIKMKKIKLK